MTETAGTPDHWFEPVAETLGTAYLRYSFTKGTVQEVDFLVAHLGLLPGEHRILDVGCGPGRHSHELARRGFEVHGIDVSQRFVDLARGAAPPGATFERLDARRLPDATDLHGRFDLVMSLCEGGFGLLDGIDDDLAVLTGMRAALRSGGRIVLTSFSAYFQMRHMENLDFEADRGINHERTEIRDEAGNVHPTVLHTTCFTPRELRMLCRLADLDVEAISSVDPGAYAVGAPDLDHSELMLIARVRSPR
jgi:SAM-dependent methyltransferase